MLAKSELVPVAVLAFPMVFENNDFDPTAVLENPKAPGTGLFLPLLNNAESPTATKLVPSVFDLKASVPIAILLKPLVFEESDRMPMAILSLPVFVEESDDAPIAVLLLPVV